MKSTKETQSVGVASMPAVSAAGSSLPTTHHHAVATAVVKKKRGVFPSLLKKTKHNKSGVVRLTPYTKKQLNPPIIKIEVEQKQSEDGTKVSSLTDADGIISRLAKAEKKEKTKNAVVGGASKRLDGMDSMNQAVETSSNALKKDFEIANGIKMSAPSPFTLDRVVVNQNSDVKSQKQQSVSQQQPPRPTQTTPAVDTVPHVSSQQWSLSFMSPSGLFNMMSGGGGGGGGGRDTTVEKETVKTATTALSQIQAPTHEVDAPPPKQKQAPKKMEEDSAETQSSSSVYTSGTEEKDSNESSRSSSGHDDSSKDKPSSKKIPFNKVQKLLEKVHPRKKAGLYDDHPDIDMKSTLTSLREQDQILLTRTSTMQSTQGVRVVSSLPVVKGGSVKEVSGECTVEASSVRSISDVVKSVDKYSQPMSDKYLQYGSSKNVSNIVSGLGDKSFEEGPDGLPQSLSYYKERLPGNYESMMSTLPDEAVLSDEDMIIGGRDDKYASMHDARKPQDPSPSMKSYPLIHLRPTTPPKGRSIDGSSSAPVDAPTSPPVETRVAVDAPASLSSSVRSDLVKKVASFAHDEVETQHTCQGDFEKYSDEIDVLLKRFFETGNSNAPREAIQQKESRDTQNESSVKDTNEREGSVVRKDPTPLSRSRAVSDTFETLKSDSGIDSALLVVTTSQSRLIEAAVNKALGGPDIQDSYSIPELKGKAPVHAEESQDPPLQDSSLSNAKDGVQGTAQSFVEETSENVGEARPLKGKSSVQSLQSSNESQSQVRQLSSEPKGSGSEPSADEPSKVASELYMLSSHHIEEEDSRKDGNDVSLSEGSNAETERRTAKGDDQNGSGANSKDTVSALKEQKSSGRYTQVAKRQDDVSFEPINQEVAEAASYSRSKVSKAASTPGQRTKGREDVSTMDQEEGTTFSRSKAVSTMGDGSTFMSGSFHENGGLVSPSSPVQMLAASFEAMVEGIPCGFTKAEPRGFSPMRRIGSYTLTDDGSSTRHEVGESSIEYSAQQLAKKERLAVGVSSSMPLPSRNESLIQQSQTVERNEIIDLSTFDQDKQAVVDRKSLSRSSNEPNSNDDPLVEVESATSSENPGNVRNGDLVKPRRSLSPMILAENSGIEAIEKASQPVDSHGRISSVFKPKLSVKTLSQSGSDSDDDVPAPPVDTNAVLEALESTLPPRSPGRSVRKSPRRRRARSPRRQRSHPSSPLMESNGCGSKTSSPKRSKDDSISPRKKAEVGKEHLPLVRKESMENEEFVVDLPREIALSADDPVSDLDQSVRHFPMQQVIADGSVNVSALDQSRDDNEARTEQIDRYVTEQEMDRYAPLIRVPRNSRLGQDPESRFALADAPDSDWSIERASSEETSQVAVDVMLGACHQTSFGKLLFGGLPWKKKTTLGSVESETFLAKSPAKRRPSSRNPRQNENTPRIDNTGLRTQHFFVEERGRDPLGRQPSLMFERRLKFDPPDDASSHGQYSVSDTGMDRYDVKDKSSGRAFCEMLPGCAQQQDDVTFLVSGKPESEVEVNIKERETLKNEAEGRSKDRKGTAMDSSNTDELAFLTAVDSDDDDNNDVDKYEAVEQTPTSRIENEKEQALLSPIREIISVDSSNSEPIGKPEADTFMERLFQFGQDVIGLSPRSKKEVDTRLHSLSPVSKRILENSIDHASAKRAQSIQSEPEIIDLTDVYTVDEEDGTWMYGRTADRLKIEDKSLWERPEVSEIMDFASFRMCSSSGSVSNGFDTKTMLHEIPSPGERMRRGQSSTSQRVGSLLDKNRMIVEGAEVPIATALKRSRQETESRCGTALEDAEKKQATSPLSDFDAFSGIDVLCGQEEFELLHHVKHENEENGDEKHLNDETVDQQTELDEARDEARQSPAPVDTTTSGRKLTSDSHEDDFEKKAPEDDVLGQSEKDTVPFVDASEEKNDDTARDQGAPVDQPVEENPTEQLPPKGRIGLNIDLTDAMLGHGRLGACSTSRISTLTRDLSYKGAESTKSEQLGQQTKRYFDFGFEDSFTRTSHDETHIKAPSGINPEILRFKEMLSAHPMFGESGSSNLSDAQREEIIDFVRRKGPAPEDFLASFQGRGHDAYSLLPPRRQGCAGATEDDDDDEIFSSVDPGLPSGEIIANRVDLFAMLCRGQFFLCGEDQERMPPTIAEQSSAKERAPKEKSVLVNRGAERITLSEQKDILDDIFENTESLVCPSPKPLENSNNDSYDETNKVATNSEKGPHQTARARLGAPKPEERLEWHRQKNLATTTVSSNHSSKTEKVVNSTRAATGIQMHERTGSPLDTLQDVNAAFKNEGTASTSPVSKVHQDDTKAGILDVFPASRRSPRSSLANVHLLKPTPEQPAAPEKRHKKAQHESGDRRHKVAPAPEDISKVTRQTKTQTPAIEATDLLQAAPESETETETDGETDDANEKEEEEMHYMTPVVAATSLLNAILPQRKKATGRPDEQQSVSPVQVVQGVDISFAARNTEAGSTETGSPKANVVNGEVVPEDIANDSIPVVPGLDMTAPTAPNIFGDDCSPSLTCASVVAVEESSSDDDSCPIVSGTDVVREERVREVQSSNQIVEGTLIHDRNATSNEVEENDEESENDTRKKRGAVSSHGSQASTKKAGSPKRQRSKSGARSISSKASSRKHKSLVDANESTSDTGGASTSSDDKKSYRRRRQAKGMNDEDSVDGRGNSSGNSNAGSMELVTTNDQPWSMFFCGTEPEDEFQTRHAKNFSDALGPLDKCQPVAEIEKNTMALVRKRDDDAACTTGESIMVASIKETARIASDLGSQCLGEEQFEEDWELSDDLVERGDANRKAAKEKDDRKSESSSRKSRRRSPSNRSRTSRSRKSVTRDTQAPPVSPNADERTAWDPSTIDSRSLISSRKRGSARVPNEISYGKDEDEYSTNSSANGPVPEEIELREGDRARRGSTNQLSSSSTGRRSVSGRKREGRPTIPSNSSQSSLSQPMISSPKLEVLDEIASGDEEESSLLLALTRSEGEPAIAISSTDGSGTNDSQLEAMLAEIEEEKRKRGLRSPNKGHRSNIDLLTASNPETQLASASNRREFTRSPRLQSVLERLRNRKRQTENDRQVTDADVTDVDELFSRYDNIVQNMVVLDNDRLQRAQERTLGSLDRKKEASVRQQSTAHSSRELGRSKQEPRAPPRSVSQPKPRAIPLAKNSITKTASFGSETSTPSQKARDLRKQLDQALKTSAAIRTTQERLGAELTTFKSRFQQQRTAHSPTASGSKEPLWTLAKMRESQSPKSNQGTADTPSSISELTSSHDSKNFSPTATEYTVVSGEVPSTSESRSIPTEVSRPTTSIGASNSHVSSLPPSTIGNMSNASPTFDQAANIFDKLLSTNHKASIMEQIPEEKSPMSDGSPSPKRTPLQTSTREAVTLSSPPTRRRRREDSMTSPSSKALSTAIASSTNQSQSPRSRTTNWTSDSSGNNILSEYSPLYSLPRGTPPSSPPQKPRNLLPPASRSDALTAALMDIDSDDDDDEDMYSTSASGSDGIRNQSTNSTDDDSTGDDVVKQQQIESILDGLRSAEEARNNRK